MSSNVSARWFAPCLLVVLMSLPACASLSSDRWKQRVQQCRQPPATPIEDAPDEMSGYVAFSAELLGIIRLERELDAVEWNCINNL